MAEGGRIPRQVNNIYVCGNLNLEHCPVKKVVIKVEGIEQVQDDEVNPTESDSGTSTFPFQRDIREQPGEIVSLLKVAELEIEVSEHRGQVAITKLRKCISKNCLTSPEDVLAWGQQRERNRDYIQAIILYKVSHDIVKLTNLSEDIRLKWIRDRVADIEDALENMIKAHTSSKTAQDFCHKIMRTILQYLYDMNVVDEFVKTIVESSCLASISKISGLLGNFDEQIELGKAGIAVLKSPLVDNDQDFIACGMLHHNLGVAYYNLGEYDTAVDHFNLAIDASAACKEFENEKQRMNDIQESQEMLDKIYRIYPYTHPSHT